jgi:hypothetical protein
MIENVQPRVLREAFAQTVCGLLLGLNAAAQIPGRRQWMNQHWPPRGPWRPAHHLYCVTCGWWRRPGLIGGLRGRIVASVLCFTDTGVALRITSSAVLPSLAHGFGDGVCSAAIIRNICFCFAFSSFIFLTASNCTSIALVFASAFLASASAFLAPVLGLLRVPNGPAKVGVSKPPRVLLRVQLLAGLVRLFRPRRNGRRLLLLVRRGQ